MKKIFTYIGIIAFTLFSFYYTDKASDVVKRNDPIMKKILSDKDNYFIESVNAIISDDEIITGINGIQVNVDDSYKNMKKHDKYDKSMYVFEEVNPIFSFTNSYDKYIVGGNRIKDKVALVFKVIDDTYLNKLYSILEDKKVKVTFFIDGEVLEDNMDIVLKLARNNEIENLGYGLKYSRDKLLYVNNIIESLTKRNPRYCYTDYKNSDVLEICSKNNMYTIKPSISVSSYPFITVKNNVSSGDIISFNINSETIKELPSIITYLKQKGYKLTVLDDLISEKYVEEK